MNRTRGPRQGEAVSAEVVWITLELDETSATNAEKHFASCNPINKKETDNSLVERNIFLMHVLENISQEPKERIK